MHALLVCCPMSERRHQAVSASVSSPMGPRSSSKLSISLSFSAVPRHLEHDRSPQLYIPVRQKAVPWVTTLTTHLFQNIGCTLFFSSGRSWDVGFCSCLFYSKPGHGTMMSECTSPDFHPCSPWPTPSAVSYQCLDAGKQTLGSLPKSLHSGCLL